METIITKIMDAHGGINRWQQLEKVTAQMKSSGKLFELRGLPPDDSIREMTVYLHEQRASLWPFGSTDKRTSFNSNRIAVETISGELLLERTGTPQEIQEHMKGESWDILDRANFNGYALWNYLTTPFFMLMSGIEIEEMPTEQHNNEIWNKLKVTFPNNIAAHSAVQYFYFGSDYLLRRLDYTVDVAGTFHAAQLVSDFIEVDGIKLPTKRRAYKMKANGEPDLNELMVAIDFDTIAFDYL